MNNLDESLSAVRRECIEFSGERHRVFLANQTVDEMVEIGLSPFTRLDDDFYLYLNTCSTQSDNLAQSGIADLMFIEDEMTSPLFFAPRRLMYSCDLTILPRGYQYNRIMVAFQDRCGAFMQALRKVPGSQLLKIRPGAGRYVYSMAQSFTFQGYRAESLEQASEYASDQSSGSRREGRL